MGNKRICFDTEDGASGPLGDRIEYTDCEIIIGGGGRGRGMIADTRFDAG